MIVTITIAALVIGIVLFKKGDKYDCSIAECMGFIVWVLAASFLVIEGYIFFVNHINVNGYVSQMNTRYETLVYQYKNNVYDNDNDLGKRDLITDIQEWNEDLAYRKVAQNDIWIGIFYPNIYDQFKFIELEENK